ncbi:MAG: hypothetical protein FJ405_14290 [Verrucomicrobia bacterium]|nr:hypothetical protein [Verrucomicrobiota bacterium]
MPFGNYDLALSTRMVIWPWMSFCFLRRGHLRHGSLKKEINKTGNSFLYFGLRLSTNLGMKKHSATSGPQKKSKCSKPVSSRLALPQDHGSFAKSIHYRVSPEELEKIGRARKHNAGRPLQTLSNADLLIALLFHFSRQLGTLGENLRLLLGFTMAESSLSQRRRALPAEVFEELLKRILKPVGLESKHPTAFYKGFRLIGIDGVSFSLPNNAQTRAKGRKYKNQHGLGAFIKLNAVVLLELVMHNPLGVVVGLASESEWALGK